MSKYETLGPAKGLDDSELLRLASIGEISINSSVPSTKEDRMEDLGMDVSLGNKIGLKDRNSLLMA